MYLNKTKLFIFSFVAICGSVALSNCSGGNKPAANTGSSKSAAAPVSMVAETADPMKDKGIGPVTTLPLAAVDQAMAAEGKKIYESKCTACHNPTTKLIGPPHKGILERRTAEWTMNMILNPQEMQDKDPIAKQLLKDYNNVAMTNQGLTQGDARKVLEYMRTM